MTAMIRKAALPALAILVIVHFVGAAVIGDNGVLAWSDYRDAKAERQVELAVLQNERARLAHRAELLDPESVDPDLADEMIRQKFGYVRPDEFVIELD